MACVKQALACIAALLTIAALFSAGCRRQVTYYDDVAPILARRCVRCHSSGGLAARPSLERYEDVVRFRERIRLAVWTRSMPPWLPDDTGVCGRWKDALWLPNDEVQMLVSWLEGSLPAGEPRDAPAPVDPTPSLEHVDAVLDAGASFEPGLVERAYRCFVVDPGLAKDRLMTALRVHSTDPRMVAQITLFALESEKAEADADALDRASPEPGYPCYGSPRVEPERLVASWTWDSPVLRFPRGTGLRLRAHRKLVMQVHYDVITSGLSASTRTRIDLELDDRGREASLIRLAASGFSLPPEQRLTSADGEMIVPSDVTLWGIAPRMHTLGKTLQVSRVGGGAPSACLGAFEHWDFYRQRFFEYVAPVRLSRGDRLRVACAYDTQSRQDPVSSGDDIRDEDCAAFLYVTE